MKNIFIIGSKGYNKNYGGWETFVTKLIDNYSDSKTLFHISEIYNSKNKSERINNNLIVDKIFTKKCGNATMLLYTIKSFKYYLNYIEKNNISNAIIYVLGLKLGLFLKLFKKKIKNLNIKIYLNPDGMEYKRAKWNYIIKSFFKISEKSMINNSDLVICDSKEIEKHINNKYKSVKTTYIAYGAENVKIKTSEKEILDNYNLKKEDYFLIVGRFVPENNYELIIKEFMKSSTNKQLVIISNIEHNNFYEQLLNKTNFNNDKRIILLGPIYEQESLTIIRKNAFAYIHGHSVGGTNPSLLEAMNITKLNILYDVCYNKEVGGKTCLYFNDENNNLKNLINSNLTEIKNKLGKQSKGRISKYYTWNAVIEKYKKIF